VRRGCPDRDRLAGAREIGGGDRAEVGLDQDVVRPERGEARVDVLLGQDRDHLAADAEQVPDRLLRERRADVHDDQHVDPHRSGDVHGHVLEQTAVDEHAPVDRHRREHAGDRHARAHRGGEVPRLQDDLVAGHEVDRHAAIRDRQVVEAAQVVGLERQEAELGLEPLPLDEAHRERDRALVHADAQLGQEAAILLLAAEVEVLAPWAVAQEVGPGALGADARQQVLQLPRRVAVCVEAADDRTHARARDAVDRDAHLLEHLEDAGVRGPAGAAARSARARRAAKVCWPAPDLEPPQRSRAARRGRRGEASAAIIHAAR
jgi:hypothetical protein